MAIVTTAVDAAPTPWRTRAPPSTAMLGARPHTTDADLQTVALEALYAHALLAGRHPLTPFDSALVARALPALIDRAVDGGPV